jgi:hypothetical protein
MRLAMQKEFEKLQQDATVDNYLAGTMKSPQSKQKKLKPKDPLDLGDGLDAQFGDATAGGKTRRQ